MAGDVNRPAFATALSAAVFGESRAGTLLNDADADYLLAVKDLGDVPAQNRADLALLLRDGYCQLIRMQRCDLAHPSRGRGLSMR